MSEAGSNVENNDTYHLKSRESRSGKERSKGATDKSLERSESIVCAPTYSKVRLKPKARLPSTAPYAECFR